MHYAADYVFLSQGKRGRMPSLLLRGIIFTLREFAYGQCRLFVITELAKRCNKIRTDDQKLGPVGDLIPGPLTERFGQIIFRPG